MATASGRSDPRWTHILLEPSSTADLLVPMRESTRLKYTCLSVSKKYIALGSNTAGVYVFGRDSLKHLQVVFGEMEAATITHVNLSPNDNFVGFVNSMGHVFVVELNIERRSKPEMVRTTANHSGLTVTSLIWDAFSSNLFVGDNSGRVSVARVPSSKAKELFTYPSEVILKLDSAVVQMDWSCGKLLVSTVNRSYLCNTDRKQYSQIGKKPRDGRFGACFFLEPDCQVPVIYSARPGSRLWEVDFSGNVLNTHQFKQLLAVSPLPVIFHRNEEVKFPDLHREWPSQSLNFHRLQHLGNHYLLMWTANGLYVLDPVSVKTVLWTYQITGIEDVITWQSELYVLHTNSKVTKLLLLPIGKCVSLLYWKHRLRLAAQVFSYFQPNIVASSFLKVFPLPTLVSLRKKLAERGENSLAENLQRFIVKVDSDACGSKERAEERKRNEPTRGFLEHGETGGSEGSCVDVGEKADRLGIQENGVTAAVLLTEWEISEGELKKPPEMILVGDVAEKQRENSASLQADLEPGELAVVGAAEQGTRNDIAQVGTVAVFVNKGNSQENSSTSDHLSSRPPTVVEAQTSTYRNQTGVPSNGDAATFGALISTMHGQESPVVGQSSKMTSKVKSEFPGCETARGAQRQMKRTSSVVGTWLTRKDSLPGGERGRRRAASAGIVEKLSSVAAQNEKGVDSVLANASSSSSMHAALPCDSPQSRVDDDRSLDVFSSRLQSKPPLRAMMDMKDSKTKSLIRSLSGKSRTVVKKERPANPSTGYSDLKFEEEQVKGTRATYSETSAPEKLPVGLAALLQATEQLEDELRDVSILVHPDRLRGVLQNWVVLLHKALQDVLCQTTENDLPAAGQEQDTGGKNGCGSILNYNQSECKEKSGGIESEWNTDVNNRLHPLNSRLDESGKETDAHCDISSADAASLILSHKDACNFFLLDKTHEQDDDHMWSSDTETVSEDLPVNHGENSKMAQIRELWDKDEMCFVTDPFYLCPQIHGCISKWVTMCFEMNCVGDMSAFVSKKHVPRSGEGERSSDLAIERENVCRHCFQVLNTASKPNSSELCTLCNYSAKCEPVCLEAKDADLATFIRLYFHFLHVSSIKRHMDRCKESCFQTWRALVHCLQETCRGDQIGCCLDKNDLQPALVLLRSGRVSQAYLILGHVARIFESSPSKAIQYAVENGRHISALDVLYLCQLHGESLSCFRHYMTERLRSFKDKDEAIFELCQNRNVLLIFLDCLLSDIDGEHVIAELPPFPCCGTHLLKWKQQETITLLFLKFLHANTKRFLRVSIKHRYWIGSLWSLKQLGYRKQMLAVIVALGDASLLDPDLSYGCLPDSEEEWLFLLELKEIQQVGSGSQFHSLAAELKKESPGTLCGLSFTWSDVVGSGGLVPLNANRSELPISWETVAGLLVHYLGPFRAIQLLKSCDIPVAALSLSFYQMCLHRALLCDQQRLIIHNMLEKINTHLWARKPTSMAPSLYYAMREEKDKIHTPTADVMGKESFAFLDVEAIQRFAEEPECHWGRTVNVQRCCASCQIPITQVVSLVEQGAVIFDCGHFYHKACAQKKFACILCSN